MKKRFLSLTLAFLMALSIVPVSNAAAAVYATPATADELAAGDASRSSGGIGFELINGELWVWGQNRSGTLGITTATDPDTKQEIAVEMNDSLPWATKINSQKFGGEKIKKVFAAYSSTFAITQSGKLYGWGGNRHNIIKADDSYVTANEPERFLNPDGSEPFGGRPVIDVQLDDHGNIVAAVEEENGDTAWYLWGANDFGQCATGTENETVTVPTVKTPYKIEKNYISGEEIICIRRTQDATAFLTKSGNVYTIGGNQFGLIGNNWGRADSVAWDAEDTESVKADKSNVYTPVKVNFGGIQINSLNAHYRVFTALDTKGRIWTWGANQRATVGKSDMLVTQLMPKPCLVFGADSINDNTLTKKAVKVFPACDAVYVLCADNTLYGWGINTGGRMDVSEGWKDTLSIYKEPVRSSPIQIMNSVSKTKTIVNLLDSFSDGILVKTRDGDQYFAGSNDAGYSGNGTTDAVAPGEVVEQESPTLPPVKPTTLNKIYMDVVYTDRDTGDIKTVSGAAGTAVTANVDAGQKFTVKVYFEDFAKLDQFILPIKFTNSNAKVVYKAGSGDEEYKAYEGDANEPLDASNIPAFGQNTGLVSNVRDSVWEGGELVHNDGYPRVNNKKGYVSVQGVTRVNNAPITGKQLMFSIDFIATANGNINFAVMDAEENNTNPDPMTTGGDPLLASDGLGAVWFVTRQLAGGTGNKDLESAFEFNEDVNSYLPTVNSMIHPLKSIGLSFLFEKDGSQYAVSDSVTEKKPDDETQTRQYYEIDKSNSETTYVVQAKPNPVNATDANIDSWDVRFDDFSGKNPTDKQVSDYIQVVQTGTKTYSFKMPETTNTTKDGYFVITAAKSGQTIEPIYVKVSSMVPPASIAIDAGDKNPAPLLVNESVAELNLLSDYTFHATVNDTDNTGNLSVTWTLYNCVENDDGTITETVIANNDPTAPAVITSSADVKDHPEQKTAHIVAQRTTPDKSYVKIKVVSTAGASVYDEATFRVELLSTGIIVNPTVYIGKNTSRQLSVSADPYDAYKPEFKIEIDPDSPAARSEHGSYISVDANGMISAGNDYYTGDEDMYDEIIITETKSDGYYKNLASGNTKTIKRVKVYVMNILPPPNMSVEALNNVGTYNDKVVFHADLKEGDSLKIYKTFMDDTSLAEEFPALTKSEIASLKEGYVFEAGLSGTGGTIGYLVTRTDGNFTQVPVSYSSEPCMLTGYVRLEGRMPTSEKNKDITVEIMGLRDADGNPIPAKTVQDETGYFEFENYVPVGTYYIKFSRDLYITRTITVTVTGQSDESDIVVSTLDNPVYLAPGDLNQPKNGRLDPAEFNNYLYQWAGKKKNRASDLRFDDYNFVERTAGDDVIGPYDINLMLRYYNRDNIYKDWVITQ